MAAWRLRDRLGAGDGGHDDAGAACFVRPVRTLRGQIVRFGVALRLYRC
jgi:hypothetical protein